MIRKAIYYTALLAVAGALPACADKSRHEPAEDSPRVVGISVGETKSTRADMVDSADDILSLGIFGYSTGAESLDGTKHSPNLFSNAEATRANASSPWTYSPVAVWPSDLNAKSSFFAYSPYRVNGAVGSDGSFEVTEVTVGYPVIRYRTPSKVSEQIDLLYSDFVTAEDASTAGDGTLQVVDMNAGTNSGEVKYTMKHALVWINFLIATELMLDPETYPDESYFITELTMLGGNIISYGEFNLGTGTWSAVGENEEILYDFDYLRDGSDANRVKAGTMRAVGSLGHTDIDGLADCLMIIPHSFSTDEHLVSVGISYTHNTTGVFSDTDTKYHIQLPFPDVALDTPGLVMTFVVKISTDGASIDFQDSSTIEEWLDTDTELREVDVY
jgi:hypothetical protein